MKKITFKKSRTTISGNVGKRIAANRKKADDSYMPDWLRIDAPTLEKLRDQERKCTR